ncbi:MAG: cytochrome C, partial [Candidatus Poribacteria bacterium]|nr:cytochrome C [Candidatus Poribacteria bacterium]
WDPHLVVPLTNVNLSYLFGIRSEVTANFFGFAVVAGYFSIGPVVYLWKYKRNRFLQELGLVRYIIVSFLFLTMLALPIKMILRIFFNVKYIWVSPWFNI